MNCGDARMFLIPQYLSKFSCLGSACEDTCCNGFEVNIPVDRASFLKYQGVKDPDLKRLFKKCVVKSPGQKSQIRYAEIKSGPDRLCPFLTGQGLCRIQLTMGEDYLPDVCFTYPRAANIVNGVTEVSAAMSCPEAARLALLNPGGIEFDEVPDLPRRRYYVVKRLETAARETRGELEYFWDLRVFTIRLLQNRDYDLADRLIILGMFCRKAQDSAVEGASHNVPEIIGYYNNLINEGTIRKSLGEISPRPAIQLELLKELMDRRFAGGAGASRLKDIYARSLEGIRYSKGAAPEEITGAYRDAHKNYYAPFMEKHQYIFENYLVNHVFMNLFPFSGYGGLFDEYIIMAVHYSMIKMLLIGLGGYYRGIDTNLAVETVQAYARTIEHSGQYLADSLGLIKKNGYDAVPHMVILLKN